MVMIHRFFALPTITVRLYSRVCSHLTSPNFVMPSERKVTIRHEPQAETFEILFRLNVPELELSREFNLKRRMNEPVECLMSRILTNMEKAFGKKLKKTKHKMKIEGKPDPVFQITAVVKKDGKPVTSDISCEQLFFNSKSDTKSVSFVLCGQNFGICVNLPYINKLSLPDVAMEGLPLFPLKFGIKFGSRELSEFRWFRAGSEQWNKVGAGFLYYPTSEDVGKALKLECTPVHAHRSGNPVSAVMSQPVKPSPGVRPYENRHQHTKLSAEYPEFRVISYNILADKYAETEAANTELFPYCPDFARTWQYRRSLIVDEIIGYRGDIICLQEVDTRAFEYDLSACLKNNYKGIFNKKYTVEEGVATFFRKDRYKLISDHVCFLGLEIDTNEMFADIWNKIKDNSALSDRIRSLGTVAQIVVLLDLKSPERIIIVGNTHLFFHPDADHIRLLQGGMYAKFLVKIVSEVRSEHPKSSVALIACGDFNSVPSCGIYSLFTKGVVGSDFPDWKSKDGEHVEGVELRQPYVVASAYGTPKYTNFTKEFADCLDYIFYQKDKLNVVGTVPLFTEEELRAHTALPSVVCPSDHIALVADLAWAGTKT